MLNAVEVAHAVEMHQLREAYYTAVKQRPVLTLEEARKRIPDHLKNTNPYSINALWKFYARTHHDPPGESCRYCQMFDGQTFLGSDLRAMFPDHKWEGDDIYANVHMTLWGKEGTCACLLIREPAGSVDLERMDLWQGVIGTDWTETPREKEEE